MIGYTYDDWLTVLMVYSVEIPNIYLLIASQMLRINCCSRNVCFDPVMGS